MKEKVCGFGLVVIGNEVLDGRREDRHFLYGRDLLTARGYDLCYTLVLPDDARVIQDQLAWAFGRPTPFFCCGGIGSTPDDITRECAAAVCSVPIARHPEGERILRARWGDGATEARLRMVDFPEGCVLIPNPVNQVPGFRLRTGSFVPGFPEMAHPMMAWVLDTWYEPARRRVSELLVLKDAKEADLVYVMEDFVRRHPEVSFSSLPRFVEGGTEVHLGVKGEQAAATLAMADLKAALAAGGWFAPAPPSCAAPQTDDDPMLP